MMIVATTPAPKHQALVEIPVSQLAKDTKQVKTVPRNVFEVTFTEQDEVVSTIQSMMNLEDQGKGPVTESATTVPAPASATVMSSDILAMKLKLSKGTKPSLGNGCHRYWNGASTPNSSTGGH